jgi:hypothetical protein
MIKVVVIGDFVPEELLLQASPDALARIASDVMAGARDFWIKRAGERLHTSQRDYINGIQEVETEAGSASITLLGDLPNMVENGMGAFDMHDTLLGPNVPIAGPGQKGKHVNAQGGFYRAIPFRHQTPGSVGKGGGQPMGSQYFKSLPSALAGTLQSDLGKAIHKAAKKLKPSTTLPAGSQGPVKAGTRLPAGVGGVMKLKPHHTTDIYAGMIKQSKAYAAATQNQYTTFRMISDNQPGKWLHPGIGAVHLADEVQKYVEENAPKAFFAMLGETLS